MKAKVITDTPFFNKGDRVKLIIDVNRAAESFNRGRIFTVRTFLREDEILDVGGSIKSRQLFSVLGTNVGFYDTELIKTDEMSPEEKIHKMECIINRLGWLEDKIDDLTMTPEVIRDMKFVSDTKINMQTKLTGKLLEGLENRQFNRIEKIIDRWFSNEDA